MKKRNKNKALSFTLSHLFHYIWTKFLVGFIRDHYEYLLFNHQSHFGPLFADPKKQYHQACLISHSFIQNQIIRKKKPVPHVSYFKNPLTKTLSISEEVFYAVFVVCIFPLTWVDLTRPHIVTWKQTLHFRCPLPYKKRIHATETACIFSTLYIYIYHCPLLPKAIYS